MIVEERFSVAASPEQVWQFFLDVPRAARCMPGVERVETIDERRYRGQLQVRIGPMKAGFAMEAILEELQPPETIRLVARGTDRGTSSLLDARATITIRPTAEGRSEVGLSTDLGIRGPLGRFGQVVIRDTVRRLTEQFLACAEQQLVPESSDS